MKAIGLLVLGALGCAVPMPGGAPRAEAIGGCPPGADPGSTVRAHSREDGRWSLIACIPNTAGEEARAARIGVVVDGVDQHLDWNEIGTTAFPNATPIGIPVMAGAQRVSSVYAWNDKGEARTAVDYPIVLAQTGGLYHARVAVTLPLTGRKPDGTQVALATHPEWAIRDCEVRAGTDLPILVEAASFTAGGFEIDVPIRANAGDRVPIASRCRANGAYGPSGTATAEIPAAPPPTPPIQPAITAVELRRCGAGNPVLATFVSGVPLAKSSLELGDPLCLTANFLATGTSSVQIAYEPAPGEGVTEPHTNENAPPWTLFGDSGGTAEDPATYTTTVGGNLAVPGRHRAVLTPCSITVGPGQTCLQAGGVPGTPFELLFDYAALAPGPTPVEPDAPTVVPGTVVEG